MSSPIELYRAQTLKLVRAPMADLSQRQTALLLTVALPTAEGERFTVRGLARKLNVAKPVITRAVNSLANEGLLKREPDPEDGRSVLIVAGVNAKTYITSLKQALAA